MHPQVLLAESRERGAESQYPLAIVNYQLIINNYQWAKGLLFLPFALSPDRGGLWGRSLKGEDPSSNEALLKRSGRFRRRRQRPNDLNDPNDPNDLNDLNDPNLTPFGV